MAKFKKRERDPNRWWLGDSDWYLTAEGGRYLILSDSKENNDCLGAYPSRDVIWHTRMVRLGEPNEEGDTVESVTPTWHILRNELVKDPEFRYGFCSAYRAFEEFLAGVYVELDWDCVTLTPRSSDDGRDVIAVNQGKERGRILEQAKAYSKTHFVTHNDVRAMAFVVMQDGNESQGAITTTSTFETRIASNRRLSCLIPQRLKLRDGSEFVNWISAYREPATSRIPVTKWGDFVPCIRPSRLRVCQ